MDAKKSQVDAMKDYIGGCQAFFEKVLTDILLRQPADPHAFLLETLNNMSPEEKAQWQLKVQNSVAGDASMLEESKAMDGVRGGSSGPLPPGAVKVVLMIQLSEKPDAKEKALAILKDLQTKSLKLAGCLNYDIAFHADTAEYCVTQAWADQGALDYMHQQQFFIDVTPKFKGVLSQPPEFRTFHPV